MKAHKRTIASAPPKVFNYVEHESKAADLEPAPRAKLLFTAWFSHGPGFQENLLFFVGPSKCKRYDVLWQESDWDDESEGDDEEGGRKAIAWVARGQLKGIQLWETLLTESWKAEKAGWDYEKPLFDEVSFKKKSLLSERQVWEMADRIWPPE